MYRIQVTIFYLLPSGEYKETILVVIGTQADLRASVREFKASLPQDTRILHTKVKATEVVVSLN